MSEAPAHASWFLDVAKRAGWQSDVDPATAAPEGHGWWQLEQLAEIYGLPLTWQPVALGPDEWPDEGAVGSIDFFREAVRGPDSYLIAERGVWSGFPDPPEFTLWRMKADETDWRFLGHIDRWPGNWTRQMPTTEST